MVTRTSTGIVIFEDGALILTDCKEGDTVIFKSMLGFSISVIGKENRIDQWPGVYESIHHAVSVVDARREKLELIQRWEDKLATSRGILIFALIGIVVLIHALVLTENQRYALATGMCRNSMNFSVDRRCIETVQTRTSWVWHLYYSFKNK